MSSNPTNRQRLEQEALLDPDADLTDEQRAAIEGLTSGEVDALISTKNKLDPWFPADLPTVIIAHGT